jgi:hypothetical protein
MNTANVLITENIKNTALAKGFINSIITSQQLIEFKNGNKPPQNE